MKDNLTVTPQHSFHYWQVSECLFHKGNQSSGDKGGIEHVRDVAMWFPLSSVTHDFAMMFEIHVVDTHRHHKLE